MATFNIDIEEKDRLRVSFGDPAQNDRIAKDAAARLDELIRDGTVSGGEVIRINGPASVIAAMVIAHRLAHLYQAVAYFDPKMDRYVVAIAHGDQYSVGDLLE